jgi:hypothetical protein
LIDFFAKHNPYAQWFFDVNGNPGYSAEDAVVRDTRGIAWAYCQNTLWPLRNDPDRMDREEQKVDGISAALGQVIISPLSSVVFGEDAND